MSMSEWAKREVEIACKREAPERKDGEWDYGCACYESALKRRTGFAEGGNEMLKALFKLAIAFILLGIFRGIVSNWVTEWPTTICFGLILAGFVANSQE